MEDGTFQLQRLNLFAQLSSINDFATGDFNGDGNLDVLAAGNLYGSEVETPRNDAGYGMVFLGDGKGGFTILRPYESGVHISGEVKSIKTIRLASGKIGYLLAKNDDFMQLLQMVDKP